MAENIKARGGDIKAAFEKLGDEGMKHVKTILNGKECTSENILKSLQEAATATKNFTVNDGTYKNACDELTKILSNSENGLVKSAQNLKAIPALAGLLGVTALLGWAIPAFNIYFTRNKLNANKNDSQNNVAPVIANNVSANTENIEIKSKQKDLINSFLTKA